MAKIKTIYGQEENFVSFPHCVEWLSAEFNLPSKLSADILRNKVFSSQGNIQINVYGKLSDDEEIEFYLVADSQKSYFPDEVEYISKLLNYLNEFAYWREPKDCEDIAFFWEQYFIQKRDLYSFFDKSVKQATELTITNYTEQLEQNTEQANSQENSSKDYIGDIPLNTNEEKLSYFINLLIEASPELQKDGRKPTYSELHTILQTRLRNKKIPSKATIQKYMNQI
ncbi:hypothetical protein ACVND7_12725 [Avibacterium paragallinarum]|uniref:Uncharacterized protein n=1 Tax=Avibacterium paragallinarum TaxID=728 RepID=A0ABU7QLA4_AVIPA|nr:hypothetical protein [Avibacterium paragallinarum]WAL57243.1 hypothetical protein OY678_02430 [Avibacterium paragallinarum]